VAFFFLDKKEAKDQGCTEKGGVPCAAAVKNKLTPFPANNLTCPYAVRKRRSNSVFDGSPAQQVPLFRPFL
jgi:hypothetical protein